MHGSSAGRIFLAYLSADELDSYLARAELVPLTPKTIIDTAELRTKISGVREDGYAFTIDEYAIGIFGMAVPVVNSNGKV